MERGKKPLELPFLPHRTISIWMAAGAVVVGAALVLPLVTLLACLPLPSPADGGAAQRARYLEYVQHPVFLFFIAVVLFPILEEIFYRGIILQVVGRYLPIWFAVVFSAAFFGVTHLGQEWATGINAFVLGCFFAWLTIRSRSLYPAMLCHAAFNFAWLFVIGPRLGVAEKIVEKQAAPEHVWELVPMGWVATSVVVLAIGLWMVWRCSRQRPMRAESGA